MMRVGYEQWKTLCLFGDVFKEVHEVTVFPSFIGRSKNAKLKLFFEEIFSAKGMNKVFEV